jgi:hypothetical protein
MRVKLTHFWGVVLALFIGVTFGVALQKYYDVGSIVDALGANHRPFPAPTATLDEEGNIPEEFQGKLSLFILAGQSNIAGRGEVPKAGQDANARVFVFGNDYHWRLAVEPIDDPSNQVDKVSEDPDAGFSPALAFATSLLEERPDMVIGLIPCARGGSSIYQWRRSLSENTLYGSCLKRVRAASTMGNVAGVLFFQGEADAIAPELYQESALFPNEWGDRFVVLVNNWRNDLGLPELPVVFAQIGSNTEPDIFTNWAIVKEQQRSVEMPFCVMITTDDLVLKDAVHFTPESYQIIGQRFAEAYLNLIQEKSFLPASSTFFPTKEEQNEQNSLGRLEHRQNRYRTSHSSYAVGQALQNCRNCFAQSGQGAGGSEAVRHTEGLWFLRGTAGRSRH